MRRVTLLCLCLAQASLLVHGQTLSGCHRHGNIEYCYDQDGEETPVTTHASVTTSTHPASAAAITTGEAQPTALTDCHLHGQQTFCMADGGAEVQVTGEADSTGEPPAEFTSCHSHGADTFCFGPGGDEVEILSENSEGGHDEHGDEGDASPAGENCHFHAGVEHCVGAGESESGSKPSCDHVDREYNIPYRIGSIFAVLATSAIAVLGPILWTRFFSSKINVLAFTVIKQFGTGIMISTAFIHLLTHAQLMFSNKCLGPLAYEATTAAIIMAGLFITFLIEYIGNRVIGSRSSRTKHEGDLEPTTPDVKSISASPQVNPALTSLGHEHHSCQDRADKLSVIIMEAGIVFHSIILGVTMIVAGDSSYTPLFIVIIFHQMFEGLALGSRIAELTCTKTWVKMVMGGIFASITPIGMAIGLGVIHEFNGNNKHTIIAMGTLDALSAGILAWAAIVDMWCHDWLQGELKNAGFVQTAVGMFSLVTGMVLMGVLGKWA